MSNCFVPRRLARELIAEADRHVPDETGGVLLGVADERHTWIDVAIGPGPNAIHRSHAFVPDAEYQEQQIAAAYEQSGRRVSYLGDWHTHPKERVYMSRRDRRTLKTIATWSPGRQPRPLMLILGGTQEWQFGAWRYPGRSRWWSSVQPELLEIILVD